MMTRKEYMHANSYASSREEQRKVHEKYYGEIVNALGGAFNIPLPFTLDVIRNALAQGDKHLNTLQLSVWDAYARHLFTERVAYVLKERGDSISMGTAVCILKRAAVMQAESNTV